MICSARITALASVAALGVFSVSPAAAAPVPASPVLQNHWAMPLPADTIDEANTLNHHRYYRGRHYRDYRYRRGPSAGDVLTGVLILGGIAAIADAAKDRDEDRRERNERYRDYRERDYRDSDYRDRDYREERRRSGSFGSAGLDRAAEQCVREIERDVRVDEVESVNRDGEGWLVTGTLFNGDGFACRIGNNGQIEEVDFTGDLASNDKGEDYGDRDFAMADQVDRSDRSADDSQWSDDRYAEARRNVDTQARSTGSVIDLGEESASPKTAPRGADDRYLDNRSADDEARRPAYPGGPLPGEEIDDADLI